MYLFVVTVVFLCWMLNVETPCMRILRVKKIMPNCLMWCCEKLRYSWRLFCWRYLGLWKNIRDVEVDTLDLPCPKLGCFTRAAMQTHVCQAWLFRGRIWHAAHALARNKKCPIEPLGKESGWLLWRATELRTPFFFRPLNGHIFWKSGTKKNGTHFCVPMGGSGIYINKKNIYIYNIHILYIPGIPKQPEGQGSFPYGSEESLHKKGFFGENHKPPLFFLLGVQASI